MTRVLGRRVFFNAALIAGAASAFLLVASSLKAEVNPSSEPAQLAPDADVSRLKDYLAEINGKTSSVARRDDGVEEIARLRNYLLSVKGSKGQSNIIVAQGGKDDLLTPSAPAPAPSGSGKPSGDDLLTPAPGGNDLLTPGNKSPEDALKVAPGAAKQSDEEAKKKQAEDRRGGRPRTQNTKSCSLKPSIRLRLPVRPAM